MWAILQGVPPPDFLQHYSYMGVSREPPRTRSEPSPSAVFDCSLLPPSTVRTNVFALEIFLHEFCNSKRRRVMSTAVETTAPVANLEHLESYKSTPVKRVQTLGTVQHRHEHTNEIILIPTPSNDPNDPLNW